MKRLLGVLAVAATLLLAVPGLAAADDVGDLCAGQPDCIVEDPTGFGSDGFGSDGFGIPGWFVALFVLVLILGVATTIYRVSAARSMARSAGLDEGAATAVAMLDENGLNAAYVASSLRDRKATAPDAAPAQPRPAAERLAELQALKDSGAITESEYAARRQAIIDSI
ncbi:SHOCT domain-containing protein [Nocardioides sp. CER19]|uniref:SHOCT domain-containing protein n=1 Tax=Nocardioides sp. CER19 TaxID=3038538 RepID=UPI00244B6753|nr:SHOCT domain-containing protein [Nocardioides sp. CER19]MDH2412673.1 SHOCT domain-containing protein [Nocardioides sp. CER19]